MDKMTLREYRIRKKAHQLNQEAEEYDRHWRAWLNWNVQGTKKQGKKIVSVYRMFKDFYDREKVQNGEKVTTEEDQRKQKMKAAARKNAERREDNGNL
ncbi:MAG: hypothetical protein ACRDBM_07895 [Sporomusa sp.]